MLTNLSIQPLKVNSDGFIIEKRWLKTIENLLNNTLWHKSIGIVILLRNKSKI